MGKELGCRIGPCLPAPKQSSPRHGRTQLFGGFLVNMSQLRSPQRGMIGGPAVITKPPQNPKKTENASRQKCRMPAVAQRYPRHNGGSKDRADVGPGVEDAGRQ